MTNNPELLYTIPEVKAYQIENGSERPLTSQNTQTLSLLMNPVSSSSLDSKTVESPQLHIRISPDLDIRLIENTKVHFPTSHSCLVPHYNAKSSSDCIIRIEFPRGNQEKGFDDDIDTFESILTQFNIVIQNNVTPHPPYDPSTYKSEQTHESIKPAPPGQVMIVDEENGNIIGELGSGFQIVADGHMSPGPNDPVEITFNNNSNKINVKPASDSYLDLAMHPVYKNSTLVSKATMASRFIVTTSDQVAKTLQSQADSYTKKTKPNSKPVKFEQTTHARTEKANKLTEDAAVLSAKTVGQVQKYAQSFGASISKRDQFQKKSSFSPDGKPIESYKPGIINKSLVAFSTIADGIDQAGRSLLLGTSTAVTTVVGHKYGPEAQKMTQNVGSGVRNVGLVYIDATGIGRRAIIKSVIKGMVVGKLPDGSEMVVGGNEGDGPDGISNQVNHTLTSRPSIAGYYVDPQKWKESEILQEKNNEFTYIPPPPPRPLTNSPPTNLSPPHLSIPEKQPPPAYSPSDGGSHNPM